MAVTHGKSPVILTASGDSFGDDGNHWFATAYRVVMGSTSGQVILLDKSGGREIYKSPQLSANGTDWVETEDVLDGIYVSALPADATVYVHYK